MGIINCIKMQSSKKYKKLSKLLYITRISFQICGERFKNIFWEFLLELIH